MKPTISTEEVLRSWITVNKLLETLTPVELRLALKHELENQRRRYIARRLANRLYRLRRNHTLEKIDKIIKQPDQRLIQEVLQEYRG